MKTNKMIKIKNLGSKKFDKQNYQSNKPEIIAWVLFFGLGISYFVITLLTSI